MKCKLIFSKTIIAIGATAAITAFGIQAHDRHESPVHAMFKKLDLTEQQKQDVRTIMKQSKQVGKTYKQDLDDIKEQLKSLIRSTSWDQVSVVALLQREQEIKSQLSLSRATNHNAIWNTLNAEQQLELAATGSESKERKGKKGDKRKSPMRMFKRLDLTEAQSTQISALLEQQKSSLESQRDTMKAYKEQAKQLIRSVDFDQASWLAVEQKMQTAHLQMATDMVSVRHQVWNILNQEQQAKMVKMDEKREARQGDDKKGKGKRQHRDEL